jgi:hypothetical protein
MCSFTAMKKTVVVVSCLFVFLTLNSCTKGGGGQDDGGQHTITFSDYVSPVLEVYTPVDGQAYSSGAAVSITGKITDESGLYQGSIRITKDSNGELVRQQLYEIHGVLAYNFNISEAISVTAPTDYTVTIKFEDHGLNVATRSVKIKVNP